MKQLFIYNRNISSKVDKNIRRSLYHRPENRWKFREMQKAVTQESWKCPNFNKVARSVSSKGDYVIYYVINHNFRRPYIIIPYGFDSLCEIKGCRLIYNVHRQSELNYPLFGSCYSTFWWPFFKERVSTHAFCIPFCDSKAGG